MYHLVVRLILDEDTLPGLLVVLLLTYGTYPAEFNVIAASIMLPNLDYPTKVTNDSLGNTRNSLGERNYPSLTPEV